MHWTKNYLHLPQMNRLAISLLLLLALLLAGCATAPNAFYKHYEGAFFPQNKNKCKALGWFNANDADQAAAYVEAQGYKFVGKSFFAIDDEYDYSRALEACDAIGADVVIIQNRFYLGSDTVAFVESRYHPGPNFYVHHYNGHGHYSGHWHSGPGFTTTSVQRYKVDFFDHGALFFVKK